MIKPWQWTLGGPQFWGDVHLCRGWRIQEHVRSGRCRLLDGRNHRICSGTYAACAHELTRLQGDMAPGPVAGDAVVLLHGIVRSSRSMRPMAQVLQNDGFETFAVDYPSTRVRLEESVNYLRRAVDSLQGFQRIHFIGHSMGGLLIRAYLGEYDNDRVGGIVMLGTPNRGAEMARQLSGFAPFHWVFGPAGRQLEPPPVGVTEGLPIPTHPTLVIAGGRGGSRGYSPWISGDNDGTVEVSSTALPGARFRLIRSMHLHLPRHPEAIRLSREFLLESRTTAVSAASGARCDSAMGQDDGERTASA